MKPVLVIEDDSDIRETLQELLEIEGYQVVTAKNGKEALQLLEKSEKSFLILLDLMMPVMSGWDLLHALKSHHVSWFKENPIYILSAANDTMLTHRNEIAGLIRKPVELDDLLRIIQDHCRSA